MGCFGSKQVRPSCVRCRRRAINNLRIIDSVCEICIAKSTANNLYNNNTASNCARPGYVNATSLNRNPQVVPLSRQPFSERSRKYGEYRCNSCGRHWDSRHCWPDKYQICNKCHKSVWSHSYRDLRATDFIDTTDQEKEHKSDLCQMCQQLGYSCKSFDKVYTKQKPKNSRRTRNTNTRMFLN